MRDIVERTNPSSSSSRPPSPPRLPKQGHNGFPSAVHRKKLHNLDFTNPRNTARVHERLTPARSEELIQLRNIVQDVGIVGESSGQGQRYDIGSDDQKASDFSLDTTIVGPPRLGEDISSIRKILTEAVEENLSRIRDMPISMIEEERKELEERFGSKMMDVLKQRAQRRNALPYMGGSESSNASGDCNHTSNAI